MKNWDAMKPANGWQWLMDVQGALHHVPTAETSKAHQALLQQAYEALKDGRRMTDMLMVRLSKEPAKSVANVEYTNICDALKALEEAGCK